MLSPKTGGRSGVSLAVESKGLKLVGQLEASQAASLFREEGVKTVMDLISEQ